MARWAAMLMVLALAACSSPESPRAPRAGDAVLAVQWPITEPGKGQGGPLEFFKGFGPVNRLYKARDEMVRAGGDLYSVTGTDNTDTLFNIYVSTARVEDAVQRLGQLERSGKVPPGMRIGLAQQSAALGEEGVAYQPVWPEGLNSFDVK